MTELKRRLYTPARQAVVCAAAGRVVLGRGALCETVVSWQFKSGQGKFKSLVP